MQEKCIYQMIKDFMNTKPQTIDIIGYGSAVKTQKSDNEKIKKQIDIIATVDCSLNWHKENMENSPSEYNVLAKFLIKPLQHVATDITYVSDIPYEDKLFKVGIIDKQDLLDDLNTWSNFFMAGRTQKPIMVVTGDKVLDEAIIKNRINALLISLILNSDKQIDETALFETLSSLSYIGDVRMTLKFENPNKVRNIVNGEIEEFKRIYSEINEDLFCLKDGYVIPNTDKILKDSSHLPNNLANYLISNKINIDNLSKEDLAILKEYIIKYITKVNLKSSINQPIKCASINNVSNSVKYMIEKRKKYIANK